MDTQFISIIQQVISDRGKIIANNRVVFNALLADYARGDFFSERRLFVKELETNSIDELMQKYQPQPVLPPAPMQQTKTISAPPPNRPEIDVGDKDDDADNEEYSEKQIKKSHEGKIYSVKCPRCGDVIEVNDKRDIHSRHLGYVCPSCRGDFIVEFFGTCKSCKEKVGFNAHRQETLIATGANRLAENISNILQNKQKGVISSIGDAIKDMHPCGTAAGECTFCKQIHVECPQCRSAVKFPHNKRIDKDIIRCHNCGQRMWHPWNQ
jgi:predicted RNA-binding Zn-ribbon protein involved in translation (DUF1610 family)